MAALAALLNELTRDELTLTIHEAKRGGFAVSNLPALEPVTLQQLPEGGFWPPNVLVNFGQRQMQMNPVLG